MHVDEVREAFWDLVPLDICARYNICAQLTKTWCQNFVNIFKTQKKVVTKQRHGFGRTHFCRPRNQLMVIFSTRAKKRPLVIVIFSPMPQNTHVSDPRTISVVLDWKPYERRGGHRFTSMDGQVRILSKQNA